MDFQYPEDEKYFIDLLAKGDKDLFYKKYFRLFDFRSPFLKRQEFNKKRSDIFKKLVKRDGLKCQLSLHPDCSKLKKFDIDHIIPLSTNELNKKLRNIKPSKGKKVPSQSFGSNDESNLILACSRCNAYKKHRIIISNNFKI